MQSLWLIASLALPTSELAVYLSLPAAVLVTSAWRRRLLPSPTVIGMVVSPAVYAVAHQLQIAPMGMIFGPTTIHKVAISIGFAAAYGMREIIRICRSWLDARIQQAIAASAQPPGDDNPADIHDQQ